MRRRKRKLKKRLESLNDLRNSWGSKVLNFKLDQLKLLRDLSDSHRRKRAATCAGLATVAVSMNQNLQAVFTTTIAFALAGV